MANQLDLLAADAINTFMVDFGEQITYTQSGTPLVRTALVFPKSPAAFLSMPGSVGYTLEIQIANDAMAGIDHVNINKDKVTITNQDTNTTEDFVVMQILDNDAGIWHLGIG